MSEFAIGEHVRIREDCQAAYHRTYWGRAGTIAGRARAGSLQSDPRYLVDYAPACGRYYVRSAHLERVAPEPRLVPVLTPKTRVVNIKFKESFDVYIGRRMPGYAPLGWGNPFRPADANGSTVGAIQRYRTWLLGKSDLLARLPELRGKTLGCWCAPKGGIGGDIHGHTCHGEVLAALADDPTLVERLVAHQKLIAKTVARYVQSLESGNCPDCGATVEREKQVGRCVYAEPCGHRLYQGKTRERVEQERKECELAQHAAAFEAHHVHTWHYWAADARYQRCSSCGKAQYVGSEVAQ